ncbi:MAG: alpha/beta fold hydrolase [Dokdonella sp.]|uniref:alpha/beta fold hydrolase n=1 Tax=Dokdonella sp. TaxID=2291710 RepID=UPI003267D188
MTSSSDANDRSTVAPADQGWLDVGHGHRVWYEQTGALDGMAVILVHGGPGSSSTARQREIFDESRYRIIQFDQRGCGRSTPAGATAHNHTDALIADMEALRTHLHVERWLVSGGSWGAALALAYAARHREQTAGVLLRGTFLTSHADLDWFFHGVAALAPQANADFMQVIPRNWRRSAVTWLDRCFSGSNLEQTLQVAGAWQTYEMRLDNPHAVPVNVASLGSDATDRLIAKYRVQAHYLARRCFLGESRVMRAAASLGGLPVALVHGTNDRVCRPQNAWRVQRACAGSRLAWAAQGGHDPTYPAVFALLRGATRAFAETRDFSTWPGDSGSTPG